MYLRFQVGGVSPRNNFFFLVCCIRYPLQIVVPGGGGPEAEPVLDRRAFCDEVGVGRPGGVAEDLRDDADMGVAGGKPDVDGLLLNNLRTLLLRGVGVNNPAR